MADVKKAAMLGATAPPEGTSPLLQERNQHVRAISGSESNLGKCFPDDAIEKVAADATDEVETVRALDGCDVVYLFCCLFAVVLNTLTRPRLSCKLDL